MALSITSSDNAGMDTWQDRAKKVMAEKKIRQARLAELLGIAQPTVNAKLNGQRPASLDELVRLAEILDVSPNWLVFGAGVQNPSVLDLARRLDALLPEQRELFFALCNPAEPGLESMESMAKKIRHEGQ